MTFSKKSLAAIQADVNNIKADVNKAYNIVDGKKNDYTREGAQKAFKNWLYQNDVPGKLIDARHDVQAWRDSAQRQADKARAKLYPKANDATEQLAAELAVSRIMGRGNFDRESLLRQFDTLGTTATRTLLIEESIARGIISQDAVEGYTKQTNEDYYQLTKQAQKAAALARSVEHQIDYLERKGDNMHLEAGATASVDVSEIEGAEVEY